VGAMQIRLYVLKNVVKTFLGALVVLYAVMGIVQGVKFGGFIGLKDIDLFILALVPMTAFVLPMALLFSILIVLERLSSESEMIAIQACGVRKPHWASVLIGLSVLCALLQIQIATEWGPRSLRTIQERLKATAPSKVFALLQERDFNDSFKNLVVYVETIDRRRETLHGVYIETKRDNEAKGDKQAVITAEAGKISLVNGAIVMLLKNGSVFQQTDKALRHLSFGEYRFKLEVASGKDHSIRKQQAATQPELRRMIAGSPDYTTWVKEYYDRYSFSLLNIIVAMMAVTFGVQRPRTPKYTGFVTGIASVIGYYLVEVFSDKMVRGELLDPFLGSWLPDFTFAIILITVWLMRRYVVKEA